MLVAFLAWAGMGTVVTERHLEIQKNEKMQMYRRGRVSHRKPWDHKPEILATWDAEGRITKL